MTQEQKELLLKDLCTRLPYGVKGKVYAEVSDGKYDMEGEMIFYDKSFDVILDGINVSTEEIHVIAIGNEDTVDFIEMQQVDGAPYTIDDFKPYLRPMESMTGVEMLEYISLKESIIASDDITYSFETYESIDWLNKNHFDYRGLIPMGLAIDATELNIY